MWQRFSGRPRRVCSAQAYVHRRLVAHLVKKQVPPDHAHIGALRAWTRDALADSGVQPAGVADIELAMSELVANAMTAAPSDDTLVELEVEPDRVRLSVRNALVGSPLQDPDHWAPADITSDRGRGLSIVKTIATEVQVSNHGGWTSVTCTFGLVG
jgi:anti-sigma regulatory factor (Ser/Thr protein kinase)